MQVINLFSTPVVVYHLESHEKFTGHEVDQLKSIVLEKQYGDDGNYLSKNTDVLADKNFQRIRKLCDHYVKCYTKNVLGIADDFVMFRSWLSMNTKGTRHINHSHRNTMISCVLYFDEFMSDNPLAPINFGQAGLDQIFKTFQFHFTVNERNQYNNKVLTIYPRTNTMIIFPGWLEHETETAVTSVKRYCLGTNYFFNGVSSSGYHQIDISVK